jgi:hypothetical protein
VTSRREGAVAGQEAASRCQHGQSWPGIRHNGAVDHAEAALLAEYPDLELGRDLAPTTAIWPTDRFRLRQGTVTALDRILEATLSRTTRLPPDARLLTASPDLGLVVAAAGGSLIVLGETRWRLAVPGADRVDRTVRQLRRAVEPQPCGHVGSCGLVLLPWRVAKGSASLDARPERKQLERLDSRWRWFSIGAARQRWRHVGGYGVDERGTPARRAEHRNDSGTRLSPLVAYRGLDLGSRAAPAQHADVYVERAGSDLTGEYGGTGTQELSWVADFQVGRPQRQRCHYPAMRDCDKVPAMIQPAVIAAAPARFDHNIFLEAPHGTELARYGSPGQAR